MNAVSRTKALHQTLSHAIVATREDPLTFQVKVIESSVGLLEN